MENSIVFDLFSDSKATAVEKISDYFNLPQSSVERSLIYGCSAESFINELRINLSAFDSSKVSIVGRHVTTSTEEELCSFRERGLLDLRLSLQEDTPLSRFLRKHMVQIDVDNRLFHFKGHTILIEGKKSSNHVCFMGHEKVCSWSFGCETFQKLAILNGKLYDLGATLEFFVAGTLEEMLDYSTVSRCPEILDTIDQLIANIRNPYARCTYPLCYDWMSRRANCYVMEFKCSLSDLETYNPVNYMDAFREIKNCFTWSNVTYDDYYERRVPQRVFDNRYLINRIIDVYVYGYGEQYGSLQPGLFIAPETLKVYKVEGGKLLSL